MFFTFSCIGKNHSSSSCCSKLQGLLVSTSFDALHLPLKSKTKSAHRENIWTWGVEIRWKNKYGLNFKLNYQKENKIVFKLLSHSEDVKSQDGMKICGVQVKLSSIVTHRAPKTPTPATFEWRGEQKVTNVNSGTAVLREITSQNHWHVATTKTFICFLQNLTHWQDEGEGVESERANRRERVSADRSLWTWGTEWEWERGRGATTSESFKPVIVVGDAEQDWGFLQHVEAKQIPLHGLFQTETDLRFAAEGREFSVTLLFGEGRNIKKR